MSSNGLGTKVWIVGKGPSLDEWQWEKHMFPRYAVNEAAFITPGCIAVCKDLRMVKIYEKKLSIDTPIYIKNITTLKRLRRFVHYPMGSILYGKNYFSSIAMCMIIAADFGLYEQHIIGCDSMDGIEGYADCIKVVATCRAGKYGCRKPLYDALIADLGITVIWEHRNIENLEN